MEELIQLEANDWPMFQEHLKQLHTSEFYLAPALQRVGNGERSNVVVQTETLVGSTTPTRTTPKSAISSTKQLLHKSLIRPPKSIKDRLKNLSPIRPEQLKLKSQGPISQAGKIQQNDTKMNKERPGSKFKMLSKTKSPIWIKQCNARGSTKLQQKKNYSMESMDSKTDRIVSSLNLEAILNNYNIWNHLTVGKLKCPLTFLNVNLLHIQGETIKLSS